MFRRDHTAADELHHEGEGYVLVARAPGACRITVPAGWNFLDIHLGKFDAAYEIAGFEEFGDTAPPSTFVFLPSNGEKEIKASRSGWSVQIAFDPALIETGDGPGKAKNGGDVDQHGLRAIFHAVDDDMIAVAQQLSGLWHADLPVPTTEQLDAVATLLIMRAAHHVAHREPRPPRTSSASRRVQAVLDHIEENLSARHGLDELAAVAGVSPYHFTRMFRQVIGRSPHQYVVERRLAHAKRRLDQSDDPIATIAHECGFGSQSHMTDVFNKTLGVTPGTVRRNAL